MKRFARYAVFPAAAILCLLPATIHALRGIQTILITHSDCKPTGGTLKTQLLDHASPTTYNSVYNETKDANNKVHGWVGYYGTTIDATSYGSNQASIAFAPGSTLGNASGNNRKHETSASGTVLTASNTGAYEVKASCEDCEHAAWVVTLKQRTWQKVSATWSPGIDSGGNEVPKQVPEWLLRVRSTNINNEVELLEMTATPTAGAFTATSTVTCLNATTGTGTSVVVTEMGTATTDPDGAWTSSAWSTDTGYNINAVAYWDVDKSYDFSCDQTAPPSNPENVSVDISFRLAIEDKSNPAPAFDENVKNLIVSDSQYGTLILIWTVSVVLNCDNTNDSCPCTKYTKTPDPGQPNVP